MAINWDDVKKRANEKGKAAEQYIQSIQKPASSVLKPRTPVAPTASFGSVIDNYNASLPGAGKLMARPLSGQQPKTPTANILQDAFDPNQNYVDKFKQGNIGGGVANVIGTGITGAQSIYLNALNNATSLAQGKGLQPFQYNMGYGEYEKAIAGRSRTVPLSEKISAVSPALGGAYRMGMEIGTDPIELTPLGFLNDIKLARGTAQGTQAYADALQAGKLSPRGLTAQPPKTDAPTRETQLQLARPLEPQLQITGPAGPQKLLTEGQNWGPPTQPDYYVNRGGVASPDAGNVSIAGELPAPKKINPVLNPTKRTLADPYKAFDAEYDKAVESVASYIRDYKGKGVEVGVIAKNGDDLMRDGGTRFAQSNNDLWYQDFYRQHGRAPRKSEAEEIAKELINDSLLHGRGEFFNEDLYNLLKVAGGKENIAPRINKTVPRVIQKPELPRRNREVPRTVTPGEIASPIDSFKQKFRGQADSLNRPVQPQTPRSRTVVPKPKETTAKAEGVFTDYYPERRASDVVISDDYVPITVEAGYRPDDMITIYRGTVEGQTGLNNGDWVTINKQLAKDYSGNGRVIEAKVKASELYAPKGEGAEELIYSTNKSIGADNLKVTNTPQTPQNRTVVPNAPQTGEKVYGKRQAWKGATRSNNNSPLLDTYKYSENESTEKWITDKINGAVGSIESKNFRNNNVTYYDKMTASFDENILVNPATVKNNVVGGLNNEVIDSKRVSRLSGSMKADGYKQGNTISIIVDAKGKAYVLEGNHRLQAAIDAGVDNVPVDIRYFDGAERAKGFWKPDNFLESITNKKSIGADNVIPPPGKRDLGADIARPEKNIDELTKEHGAIPKGEQPRAREVDIPKKTNYGDVQQHARTLQESAIVDDTLFKDINEAITQGSFTKVSKGNKTVIENANYTLDTNGLDGALDKFKSVLKAEKRVTSEDIALGNRVLQELQKGGRYDDALEVAIDLSEMLSETGRNLQAAQIAKRLSPEGRLMHATRAAEKISKKTGKKIKLSDETVEAISKAKTEKEIIAANEKAGVEIWDQTPADWISKVNSWRYISMLMNPKTHVRNIVGNALFLPVREFKNLIGTGLERTLIKGGERTKAILHPTKDVDLLKFADGDFGNVKSILRGEGKIDDSFRKLEAKVFNTKALEAVRKLNLNALDVEDVWFMRAAYDSSLAQYMKANGIKPAGMVGEALEKGRKYAMNESLKATYRDFNSLANLISRGKSVGSSGKKGWMGKAGSVALEGVIPFAKTPMNLVKRGVGYSPANLVRGLVNLNKVKSGKIAATEAIDQLASGLSGSALLGLGTFLGYNNIVSGKEGEYRDKLYNYNQMLGSQNYSLNIDGTSFTLDWAAPMSMPFFVGVELAKTIKDGNGDLSAVLDSYTKITDPMVNMSMLKGINDLMTNNFEGLGQTTMDIGMGYAGQFNPTAFGQIARTLDGKRRSTISTAETGLGRTMEKFGRKQLTKVPGASQKLEPYVDMWGREQEGGNVIENFLSPGYFKQSNITPVDKELRSLMKGLDEVNVKKVLPTSSAYQYTIKASGEEYRMTEKESTAYQKTRGQEGYKGLQKLFNSSKYMSMTKEEKVKAIEEVYNDAMDKAKYNYLSGKNLPVTLALGKEQHDKYQSVKSTGISDRQYYAVRKKIDALESVNQETAAEALENIGMSQKQKEAMWYTINSGWTEASNPYKDPNTDYKFDLMNDTRQEKFTYVADSGVTKQQYANILGRADTSGNGSITKEELKTAMLREGLSSSQRHSMYKVVNSNWKGE